MTTSKRLTYAGKEFPSQNALAKFLAPLVGRTPAAVALQLYKRNNDADAVIAFCRGQDSAAAAKVLTFAGRNFAHPRALADHLADENGWSAESVYLMLRQTGNDVAATIEHFRHIVNRFGPSVEAGALARVMEAAQRATGLDQKDLTALSVQVDPYRLDTRAGHRAARWFMAQYKQFVPDGRTVHLRGLFYCIVAAANVTRPDNGTIFASTSRDWLFLYAQASKAARWLGYIPFDRIRDERNDPPLTVLPQSERGRPYATLLHSNHAILMPPAGAPAPDALMPWPATYGFAERQPFRVILLGEKSSLGEVLLPLAERYDAELLLPTGEATETMIHAMVARAAEDVRPSVCLYFSDFDPSGNQMAVSVARKIQAHRDMGFPDLNMQVLPVALTRDQCVEYDLPQSPLKPTERRSDRWRQAHGREQTEIDALAALRPDVLRDIAQAAIEWFYDPTLRARTSDAIRPWRDAARRLIKTHPAHAEAKALIEEAVEVVDSAIDELREAVDALTEAQEEAQEMLAAIELPPLPDLPEPELPTSPEPLFTTDDDYVSATHKLRERKAFEDGEQSEEGDPA